MQYVMIDSHCHLDLIKAPLSTQKVIDDAAQLGVDKILVPGISPSNWQQVELLSRQNESVYYALGCHPMYLSADISSSLRRLELALDNRNERCVAVGECGLDFYKGREDADLQLEYLVKQLKLANQHLLPVILHCRKAHQDLVKVLKANKPIKGGVLHGFTGSYQQAMEYVKLGLKIGVGGSITYPRASKTRQAISQLPLDSLVLETDAPDMPLNGKQGSQNEPKFIKLVLNELILLRNEGEQTVALKVHYNASSVFDFC
ncbi:TatD family hydrolase [Vibrio maerlii]|uniref:TatD family hydrolase n=1 Tax=Vibrio maerlii TaxID=2231648 RepID=UPI001F129BDB|nr:TatD family hydrolase [Vibrio maerlii]